MTRNEMNYIFFRSEYGIITWEEKKKKEKDVK